MAKPVNSCGSNKKQRKNQPSTAFSESELDAARQLIQLIAGDSSDRTHLHEKEDEEEEISGENIYSVEQGKPKRSSKIDRSESDALFSSSSSSSLSSWSSSILIKTEEDEEDEEDEDDDGSSFGPRRNKRYRSVGDLYSVTNIEFEPVSSINC